MSFSSLFFNFIYVSPPLISVLFFKICIQYLDDFPVVKKNHEIFLQKILQLQARITESRVRWSRVSQELEKCDSSGLSHQVRMLFSTTVSDCVCDSV